MAEETKEVIILELRVEDGQGGKAVPEQKKEVEALASSILGLQQANKKLREERKLLDTSTTEGTRRIKEINSEIDKNDKLIKSNSSSLEKQRLNIGNYTGALDKLIPGLGATVEGIMGMTKASLAFIATPIGAVIAAIGLALAAIISYFKGSEEGADKFAKMAAQASAVIKVLTDRLIQFGAGMVAFLSGNFEEGIDKMTGSFEGMGDEMEREIKLAGELADIFDTLEEMELDQSVAISTTANAIKNLLIQAKDRTKSERDRMALQQQAIDLEKKQAGEIQAIQLARLSASAQQLQIDFSQHAEAQKANEDTLQFVHRLIDNEGILFDKRKELADQLIKYNETQGNSLNMQEKILNQQEALAQKEKDRLEKERAEREKKQKEEEERIAAALEQRINTLKQFEDFEAESQQNIYDTAKAFRDQEEKEKKDKLDRELKAKKDAADKEKQIEKLKNDALIGGVQLITKEKTGARVALSAIFKKDAIKETVTNTYAAAVAAYKSLAGIPIVGPALGAVAAGIVAAFGASQVAKMVGIQFARGGRANKTGTTGGRSHAEGGTRYWGEDGNMVELEAGENWYVLKRSASDEINRLSGLNQKHGGVSFSEKGWYRAAGGQVETRIAAQGGVNARDIDQIVRTTMSSMPPIYVVAQDVSQVLDTDSRIQNRAIAI